MKPENKWQHREAQPSIPNAPDAPTIGTRERQSQSR